MRIRERKLFLVLNKEHVEGTSTSVLRAGTKEEMTASSCHSSLSSCYMTKEQDWQGHIRVEGDSSSFVPTTAYLNLKVPCCGCWPFLRRTHRLATFHFDGESSLSHMSRSATLDVQRLLKSREKIDTSTLHVKLCVLTHQEKLVSRIDLGVFLDELLRPGPITSLTLKGREGQIEVKLILSQQFDTQHEELHLQTDDETRVAEQIIDTLNDDKNVESFTHSSLQGEGVHGHSQDSAEVSTYNDRSQEEQQEQEAELWVHRSIHVAPRFKERLAGPGECFLEYLRQHYSVLINLEDSRKKLHIKGLKNPTEECNLYVRDLLAKWKREETDKEQQMLRLFH